MVHSLEVNINHILSQTPAETSWSVTVLDAQGQVAVQAERGSNQEYEALSLANVSLLRAMQLRAADLDEKVRIAARHGQKGGPLYYASRIKPHITLSKRTLAHLAASRSDHTAFKALLDTFGEPDQDPIDEVNATLADAHTLESSRLVRTTEGGVYTGLTTSVDAARIFRATLLGSEEYAALLSRNVRTLGLRHAIKSTSGGTPVGRQSKLSKALDVAHLVALGRVRSFPQTEFPNKQGVDIDPVYGKEYNEVINVCGLTMAALSRDYPKDTPPVPEHSAYRTADQLGQAVLRAT